MGNFINGIAKSNYSIGIGVGLRVFGVLSTHGLEYNLPNTRFDFAVPIYLDNRVYFPKKKISPFLALGIGGSLGIEILNEDIGTGLFVNSSFGISWKISNKSSLVTGIVCEFSNSGYEGYGDWENLNNYIKENSSSLGFYVGISF